MAKILVIDDDVELSEVLEAVLKKEGYSVDLCHSGRDALQILDFSQYDILVLDWELGDIAGPELCKTFRSRGVTSPVLMVTARADIDSKVEGMDKGCDDYLVKPFDHREVLVRLRALQRRTPTVTSENLEYKELVVNTREAKVLYKGGELKIQPLELRLLELFVRNKGQWFKSEELLAKVWPASSTATTDTVRVSINRLRAVLEPAGLSESLQSMRNLGYRLE